MSVSEVNAIDYLGTDDRDGKTYLVITDHLPWDDGAEQSHLELLQKKLNSYLAFIESGQIFTDFPDAKGRTLVIKVNYLHSLSPRAEEFYRMVREFICSTGLEFDSEHRT